MPSLFAANWKMIQYDINKTKRNFEVAFSNGNREEALQYFSEMQNIFETKTCLNIASFFEKRKVESAQKKVLGEMEKQLIQKGWLKLSIED